MNQCPVHSFKEHRRTGVKIEITNPNWFVIFESKIRSLETPKTFPYLPRFKTVSLKNYQKSNIGVWLLVKQPTFVTFLST
jgi:hypothetical protein